MNASKSWTKFFFCIMKSAPFFFASSAMFSRELITTIVVSGMFVLKNWQTSSPSLFWRFCESRFMSKRAMFGIWILSDWYASMMLFLFSK